MLLISLRGNAYVEVKKKISLKMTLGFQKESAKSLVPRNILFLKLQPSTSNA